jgi:hypothetical protein
VNFHVTVVLDAYLSCGRAPVEPEGVSVRTLGLPRDVDVFMPAAEDVAGLDASSVTERLGISPSLSGYQVIEFPTPASGIASPINRTNPGFIGRGRTVGGAKECVLPNQQLPVSSIVWIVS